MRIVGAAAVALAVAAAPATAETLAEANGLVIADGVARAVGMAARSGAGYFTVTNDGDEDDRLVAVESAAAERVELHAHVLEDGVARMFALEDGVVLPAGASVELAQGGLHVMFMGLTEAWDPQAGVAVTLVFERAGEVEVVLPVAQAERGQHGRGQHGHGLGAQPPAE